MTICDRCLGSRYPNIVAISNSAELRMWITLCEMCRQDLMVVVKQFASAPAPTPLVLAPILAGSNTKCEDVQ